MFDAAVDRGTGLEAVQVLRDDAVRIEVSEADLRGLPERLLRTRWPERETVEDRSQGVPLAYLQDLCGYWPTDTTGVPPRRGWTRCRGSAP